VIKSSERILVKQEKTPDNISDHCLRLSRISALGFMSSSMMHDIGNALTVISGNSQIIQIKGDNQTIDQIQSRIETILEQVVRIQNITDRVGSFGSRLSGVQKKIDPYYPLGNALYALSRKCSIAGIECESNNSKKLANIFCDPSIMEFIFLEFLLLFLKHPIDGSKLTVNSELDKGKFNIKAWFTSKSSMQKIFELWDNPNLESSLYAALIGLEECKGTVKLIKNTEGVGWLISISSSTNEE